MDACRKYVFEPAGMSSSGFCGDEIPEAKQARGYSDTRVRLAAEHAYKGTYGWHYKGMGGLVTNTTDLLAFTKAFTSGKIIRKKNVKRMWTPLSEYRGLGWSIAKNTPSGGRRIGHGGDVAGFHTSYQHFADDDATIIVLCNHDLVPAWKTGWDLEAILFGNTPTNLKPPKAAEIPTKTLKAMAGNYVFNEGGSIELQPIPGGMMVIPHGWRAAAQLQGGNPSPQASMAENRFEEIFKAIQEDNIEDLAKHIADRIPQNWANRLCDQIWPAHLEEHGALLGYELLSIDDRGNQNATLWYSMLHEKRSTYVHVGLEGGKISYLNWNSDNPPPSTSFRTIATAKDLLVSFDLESNKETLELIPIAKGNKVVAIEIGPKGGTKQKLKRE